jgi:hypothetical protein
MVWHFLSLPFLLLSLLVLALVVVALLDAIASVVVVVLFLLSVCYFCVNTFTNYS